MKSTPHNPMEPSARSKWFAGIVVIGYTLLSLIPLAWIIATSFRTPEDSIAYPPKVLAQPSLIGYVNLFTQRSRVGQDVLAQEPPPKTWYESLIREQQMILVGPSRFIDRYVNSLVIGFGSTLVSIILGTLAAYAFSRFRVPGKADLRFFILSTRMMPPIAIAIPVYLMFRAVGLTDTYTGMIVLYTVVNLSLSVWLLQGFMDEIPREYEEAAMVDGYTRWQCFLRVVLPQAATGIATTSIFCLIFAWNEYAFALLLTSGNAQTSPPFIPTIIGEGGLDWPAMAAGTSLFLLPVLFFTVLLRKHLLRGVTFGAIRK